eukprot:CAMPEP_0184678908 /NCGR_PEP_ID=MMETSP0312-20130426/1721_1 /TAXON_ID=31354 /ORGANISM="Compsopogon coeruleus, Strain SAG 36.94" /LENGTH=1264 /DNA_ID=CAMNT_0027128011 /DNA_START=113 /DNA_END=3904 /DNA_ORIENTATION=+
MTDRVSHKHWKVREAAYKSLGSAMAGAEEGSKAYAEWGGSLSKFLRDSNAASQLAALEAAETFAGYAPDNVVAKVAVDCGRALAEKCLQGRPANRTRAAEVVAGFVQADAGESILDGFLTIGLPHKVPKVVVAVCEIFKQVLESFGPTAVSAPKFIQRIVGLLGHGNADVRSGVKAIILEVAKWMGDAPVRVLLKDLKDVAVKELEAGFAELSSQPRPVPTKFTRSSQGALEASVPDEQQPEQVDPMSLMEPIDLMSKITAMRFEVEEEVFREWGVAVESKKWNIRKNALDEVVTVADQQPIAPGEFGELIGRLRRILAKDNNVNVAASAAKVVSCLANGLRSNLSLSHSKQLCSDLLGRLKEKNRTLLEAVVNALDALHERKCITIEDVIDEINSAATNKVPKAREVALLWLRTCLERAHASEIKSASKGLLPILVKASEDAMAEIRDLSLECLAHIGASCGPRVINPSLEKLEKLRQDKVQALMANLKPVGSTPADPPPSRQALITNSKPAGSAPADPPPSREDVADIQTCEDVSKPELETRSGRLSGPKPKADSEHRKPAGRRPVSSQPWRDAPSAGEEDKKGFPQTSELSRMNSGRTKSNAENGPISRARRSVRASGDFAAATPAAVPETPVPLDISKVFSAKIMADLENRNWSIRLQALQLIDSSLDVAVLSDRSEIPDQVFLHIRARTSDTNRNLATVAFSILGKLGDIRLIRVTGSRAALVLPLALTKGLIDAKKSIRAASVECVQCWTNSLGLDCVFPHVLRALLTENSSLRKDILTWLVPLIQEEENRKCLKLEDINAAIPVALSCLRDRATEVRQMAEHLMELTTSRCDQNILQRAVRDLTEAQKVQMKLSLSKFGLDIATQATPKSKMTPGRTGGPAPSNQERKRVTSPQPFNSRALRTPPSMSRRSMRSSLSDRSDRSDRSFKGAVQRSPLSADEIIPRYGVSALNDVSNRSLPPRVIEAMSIPTPAPTKSQEPEEPTPALHHFQSRAGAQMLKERSVARQILCHLASPELESRLEGVKILCATLQSRPTLLFSEISRILISLVDLVIDAIDGATDDAAWYRALKYGLNGLMQLVLQKEAMHVCDQFSLQTFFENLLDLWMDARVKDLEDSQQVSKCVNLLLMKLIENGSGEEVFNVLINSLHLASKSDDVGGRKRIELIIRCIHLQVSSRVETMDKALMMRDMHLFLTAHPRRELNENSQEALAVRSVNKVLTKLVHLYGEGIYDFMSFIPVERKPVIVQHVEAMLSCIVD